MQAFCAYCGRPVRKPGSRTHSSCAISAGQAARHAARTRSPEEHEEHERRVALYRERASRRLPLFGR